LFGRGAEAISTFTYDLFLSFAGGQREFVRSLARELSDRKLRVFFDEASIDAGTRWVDVLAEGLKKARSLIVLVDGPPSTWQRLEVEAFRSGMAASTETRFIVPVRMGDLPPWPELNPLHALEGRRRSPA